MKMVRAGIGGELIGAGVLAGAVDSDDVERWGRRYEDAGHCSMQVSQGTGDEALASELRDVPPARLGTQTLRVGGLSEREGRCRGQWRRCPQV